MDKQVSEYICEMFSQNEKIRRPDSELKAKLSQAFPDGKPYLRDISNLRALYRAGHFSRKEKRKSTRYGFDGKPAVKFSKSG